MKNFFKNNKQQILKDFVWLIPGLEIKRWFALIFLGSILITLGALMLFNLRPNFNGTNQKN